VAVGNHSQIIGAGLSLRALDLRVRWQVALGDAVKATFFIIGRMARQFPDVVRREYAAGYTIGAHSQNHPDLGCVKTQKNEKRGELIFLSSIEMGLACEFLPT
jgi:hypothetical protein